MGKWKKSSEGLIEQFHGALEGFDGIDRKKMFGYPCCFCNGNMFTGLHEENWILRLSEEDRNEIGGLGAEPFAPMGRAMREYVLLPNAIIKSSDQLKRWIERSLSFVSALPHKLPKKRKQR
ncbi:MAG: hypothetical protein K1060chlam2_01011 [Chlamydiae bacterium]|nr:hypothetical protein [Chlamydiota bacterium]